MWSVVLITRSTVFLVIFTKLHKRYEIFNKLCQYVWSSLCFMVQRFTWADDFTISVNNKAYASGFQPDDMLSALHIM